MRSTWPWTWSRTCRTGSGRGVRIQTCSSRNIPVAVSSACVCLCSRGARVAQCCVVDGASHLGTGRGRARSCLRLPWPCCAPPHTTSAALSAAFACSRIHRWAWSAHGCPTFPQSTSGSARTGKLPEAGSGFSRPRNSQCKLRGKRKPTRRQPCCLRLLPPPHPPMHPLQAVSKAAAAATAPAAAALGPSLKIRKTYRICLQCHELSFISTEVRMRSALANLTA